MLVVALAAYMTSAAFLAAPAAPIAHAVNLLSRPWDLLPAALFLFAAVCFRQHIKNDCDRKSAASLFDRSLFVVASLNVICHASAAFSRQLFDGPFFLAELSKTFSYVVMLSGALLDQARLFEQVRSMAVTDPLTGLSNYRRLISVLEAEVDRSRRTQRPFSVVLLDMDGLKVINDQYGHLTGSRALVRIGKILRNHSRAIDTAARYGGDEFALVWRYSRETSRRRRPRPLCHEAPWQEQRAKSRAHCRVFVRVKKTCLTRKNLCFTESNSASRWKSPF